MAKSKTSFVTAVILHSLFIIFWLGLLVYAISKNEATFFVVIIFLGFTDISVYGLFNVISAYNKPLSPEEIETKKKKEERVALVLTPLILIALMVWQHNYTSPILWIFVVFSMLGCIQFLPKRAQEFIGRVFGITFGGIWKVLKVIGWILIIILIIWGVIALLSGLATISTTNAILILILWAIMSQGEKNS